jgi:hypothetical protein
VADLVDTSEVLKHAANLPSCDFTVAHDECPAEVDYAMLVAHPDGRIAKRGLCERHADFVAQLDAAGVLTLTWWSLFPPSPGMTP